MVDDIHPHALVLGFHAEQGFAVFEDAELLQLLGLLQRSLRPGMEAQQELPPKEVHAQMPPDRMGGF